MGILFNPICGIRLGDTGKAPIHICIHSQHFGIDLPYSQTQIDEVAARRLAFLDVVD